MQSPTAPAARVAVVPVREGEVAALVTAVGTVVPIQTSNVAAGAAGKVTNYPFREGQFVRTDDVLCQLRDVTLAIEMEGARKLLAEKAQQLAQLEAGYRREEIDGAQARMLAAEAMLKNAQAHFSRVSELRQRGSGLVTQQELDSAHYEAQRSQQEHAAARAEYEMKRSGYRPEEIAAAAAAVEAQKQQVAFYEDEMTKRTIRAPFDGHLVRQQTELGQWVEMGGVVATLARLDEVEVRVNVEESKIGLVSVGQQVDVTVDGWSDPVLGGSRSSEPLVGTVVFIVPRADWQSGSRSFPVVVRLKNEIVGGQPTLKEGMLARVRLRGPAHRALLAHKDAILRSPTRSVVYVVGDDRRVRPVEVVEGLSDGEYIEVSGQLAVGDPLVTEGTERLRPFAEVTVLEGVARGAQAARPAGSPAALEAQSANEVPATAKSGG